VLVSLIERSIGAGEPESSPTHLHVILEERGEARLADLGLVRVESFLGHFLAGGGLRGVGLLVVFVLLQHLSLFVDASGG